MSTTPNPPTTRETVALHALLSRHVWDDENNDEVVYIQGHGLDDDQVTAIISAWFKQSDPSNPDVPTVENWTEIDAFDMADGQKVYATRVCVTFDV